MFRFIQSFILHPSALLLFFLSWWLFGRPPAAHAHAQLARAEPAPNAVLAESPGQITIWFTEPIAPEFSQIRVLDTGGAPVDNGDSALNANDATQISVSLPPLPNGAYTVAWKNLSTVDGHTVTGSFVIFVGESPGSGGDQPSAAAEEGPLFQSPADPFLRWLVLFGSLAVVGGLAFDLFIVQPTVNPASSDAHRRLSERLNNRLVRFTWIAAGVFLLASMVQLLVQASAAQNVPITEALGQPALAVLTVTEWGRWWLWRMGLFLLLVVLLPTARPAPPWRNGLALLMGAAVLLTLSLASHGAATAELRRAAIFSDFLHLLAAAFWVGGLFHFALTVLVVTQELPDDQRRAVLAGMVPRFSTIATLSVGTLIITGLFASYAQVTIPAALLTPYGRTLLAKLALIIPLLLLGAINLLRISPRLNDRRRPTADRSDRHPVTLLRRTVTLEALLGLVVLLAVGLLISLEPARQVASRLGLGPTADLTFSEIVEGADITLAVAPGQVGANRVVITLADSQGQPIANATNVSLSLGYLETDLSPVTAEATQTEPGQYVAEEIFLSLTGAWQVEALIIRPDAFDARAAFRFEVGAAGAGGSARIAPSPQTGAILWGVELVLLGVLFVGVALVIGGWRTGRGYAILVPGVVGLAAGIALLLNPDMAISAESLVNPIPPTQASVETGLAIYDRQCAACHGPGGWGDGPLAVDLNPPPANLLEHAPLHPDGQLYRFVQDGIPGTAMQPYEDTLSDEEIWHVVNFLRALVGPDLH